MHRPVPAKPASNGVMQALAAYLLWGLMPLFFKLLAHVPALEVVAHRVIWSVPILIAILLVRKRIGELRAALATPKTRNLLLLSASLIAANWLVYIWAIYHDHVLAASLGYFLNPLVNVALGYLVLKERLNRWQVLAVGLALAGVLVLAAGALDTLWISVALAFSFGGYGLVRKIAPVASIPGLAAETLLLLPVALAYGLWVLLAGTTSGFGSDPGTGLLMMAAGLVTAVPLILFAAAAKKMSYTTMGFFQYIAPTLQFMLGVFVFGEVLTTAHIVCFSLIWLGLMVFSGNAVAEARRAP